MTRPDDPYQPFSAGYTLVNDVEVTTWSDDVAAMPQDLYDDLATHFGTPIVGYIGGEHYYLASHRRGIPADTVAVPRANHRASDPRSLLIQK